MPPEELRDADAPLAPGTATPVNWLALIETG
jgi:hypothetical protein